MGYIGGVRLSKFIDPESAGTFEGFRFKGKGTMVIELPNHSRSFLKAARRESLSSEGFMFEGCYMKPDMQGDSGVGGLRGSGSPFT